MKKKNLILLLIVICGFLWMPQRAYAQTNTYVGIHAPNVGESFSNTIWGSSSTEYSLSFELYNNTDKVVVLEDTLIKKNKDYTLSVKLSPYEGEILPDDLVVYLSGYDDSDFYVDKTEATQTQTAYEFQVHYNTAMDSNTIYGQTRITDFAKPYVGKNVVYNDINKNDTNRKKYTLTQGWYEQGSSTRLTESNTFQANKIYEYRITIEAKDGYHFSDHYHEEYDYYIFQESGYYVNSERTVNTSTKRTWVYTYNTEQVENRIYGPLELTLPALVKNQTIPQIVSTDSRYDINGFWYYYDDSFRQIYLENGKWYYYENEEKIYLEKEDIFETGKYYYYSLDIVPKDGYSIENNIDIAINNPDGNYSSINCYSSWTDHGSITVYFSEYGEYDNNQIRNIYHSNAQEASPKVGKKPIALRTYSYIDMEEEELEITDQKWYVGSSLMGTNDVFIQNRSYRLVVTYHSLGEHFFQDTVEINSMRYASSFFTGYNIVSLSEKEAVIEYNYTI